MFKKDELDLNYTMEFRISSLALLNCRATLKPKAIRILN